MADDPATLAAVTRAIAAAARERAALILDARRAAFYAFADALDAAARTLVAATLANDHAPRGAKQD